MSGEFEIEVYRNHRESQDKYIYFLLAAAGASIAFAITQTTAVDMSRSQILLAICVFSWGLSFYFGCKVLRTISSILHANTHLHEVMKGTHPNAGNHPQAIQAAREGILEAVQQHNNKLNKFSYWQFTLLITGAIFYIAWHILEMYLRSLN